MGHGKEAHLVVSFEFAHDRANQDLGNAVIAIEVATITYEKINVPL